MCAMKTPGVYIVEKNAFPNSVVEVATAVPAFIGYTERAKNGTKSLINVPSRITSLAEYEQYFGEAPVPKFSFVTKEKGTSDLMVDQNTVKTSLLFLQANALQLKKSIEDIEKLKATQLADSDKLIFVTVNAEKAAKFLKEIVEALSDALKNIFSEDNSISKGLSDATTGFKTDTADDVKAFADTIGNLVLQINATTVPNKYYDLTRTDIYNLHYHLRFFFANGGGPCYIVSVGNYEEDIEKEKLEKGISYLLKEQEPTIVLVPEAVYLSEKQDCYDIQTTMLKHCGGDMRNRIALFDIYDGYKDRNDESGDYVTLFREAIGTEFLDFGGVYYPWLNTSIVSENELNFKNLLGSWEILKLFLTVHSLPLNYYITQLNGVITAINETKATDANEEITLHKIFTKQSTAYASIIKQMLQKLNLLPPASAMAGIYTLVDSTKEVWKAPANIGISNVISPAVNISNAIQEDLNVPLNGKAVNAIRYFVGEGVKVWGARTLDGNSLDWRYINVRRTMIMLEESIKNASKAFVFEPNVANTWVSVRSMISNFLNGIWKRGGLAGASPDDAFSVHIGLGETMTPEDILEGIMRITVLVAIVRPAEFIEITFQQQMQKS